MSGASRPNCATASRPSCAVAAMRQPCAAQSIERASAPKTAGSLSTSITLYIMSCLRSVAWGSRVRLFPVCVPVSAAGQRPKNRAGSPSDRRGKLPQTDKNSQCPHKRRKNVSWKKNNFFAVFFYHTTAKRAGKENFLSGLQENCVTPAIGQIETRNWAKTSQFCRLARVTMGTGSPQPPAGIPRRALPGLGDFSRIEIRLGWCYHNYNHRIFDRDCLESLSFVSFFNEIYFRNLCCGYHERGLSAHP